MESITVKKLMEITKGDCLQGDESLEFTGVSIDSRKIMTGDLYIPIVGENNNGHIFIDKVFEAGGKVTLTQEKERLFPEGMTVIYVKSTLAAMKALAKEHRHRYKIPVIAITGSSGKTTTKDLVAAVLEKKYCTLKTQGNFNNEYGIPQTLFLMRPEHEIAVIEMGMDHLGDIECSIEEVDPEIAVITNIGLTHIEILKTQENIYKAKKEIFQTLTKNDIALVNGDDVFLKRLAEESPLFTLKTIGIHGEHDLKALSYTSTGDGIEMSVLWKGQEESYTFSYPGKHNVYNLLVAIWLGHHYGMKPQKIQEGLDAFVPSGNRMDIFDVNEMKIINDSYNANPDAMQSALEVLKTMKTSKYQRAIAILGDMLEMGEFAQKAHYDTGVYARDCADILITVGSLAKEIARGYGEKDVHSVENAKEAGECIAKIKKAGDIILIKASRGIGLEKVIEDIKGEKN